MKIVHLIYFNRQEVGVSVEYAMSSIFAATSAMSGKAVVLSLKKWIGCSVFYTLIAPPSSGKSDAIALTHGAIDKMERFLKIQRSMLISAPTIEALSKFCSALTAIICKFAVFVNVFNLNL